MAKKRAARKRSSAAKPEGNPFSKYTPEPAISKKEARSRRAVERKQRIMKEKEAKAASNKGVRKLLKPPKRFHKKFTAEGLQKALRGEPITMADIADMKKNKKGEDVIGGKDVRRFRDWMAKREEILKEGADAFNARLDAGDAAAAAMMKDLGSSHAGRPKGDKSKSGNSESGSPGKAQGHRGKDGKFTGKPKKSRKKKEQK